MKRFGTLLLAACLLTAPQFAGKAQAEGFALSDFGARGTSLAGGMVGRADDPSAVAWNPAGITQLPGTQTMVGMTLIQPSGTVDTEDAFGVGHSTDVDKHTWANPHAYLTHQFSDNLWGGIGIFSRFGLGNSYPTNWPGRENLKYVSLKTVSLNPNLAFKVNDNLSLAVGLEFMYATMLMKKDYGLGPLGYNQQKLTGSSIAPGFNLAAHYTFNDQWAAGLTYRSRVTQRVHGDLEFDNKNVATPYGNKPFPNSRLHGHLHRPDLAAHRRPELRSRDGLHRMEQLPFPEYPHSRIRHRVQRQELARHVGLQFQRRIQGAGLADAARRLRL